MNKKKQKYQLTNDWLTQFSIHSLIGRSASHNEKIHLSI